MDITNNFKYYLLIYFFIICCNNSTNKSEIEELKDLPENFITNAYITITNTV